MKAIQKRIKRLRAAKMPENWEIVRQIVDREGPFQEITQMIYGPGKKSPQTIKYLRKMSRLGPPPICDIDGNPIHDEWGRPIDKGQQWPEIPEGEVPEDLIIND